MLFLTSRVINNKGSNTTLSTKVKDLQIDPEEHHPGLGTFQFAIGAADNNDVVFYNESYYKIEVAQGINTRDGLTTNYDFSNRLNLSEWDDEITQKITISGSSLSTEDRNSAKWLQNSNYTLSGTYVSNTMKYLYIVIRKWSVLFNDTNCASDAEIDEKMDGGMFSLIIVNSYVDFDDYENVLKTYTDERFYYKMRKGITKEPEILVRKNHVVLVDEFVQIGQTENKEFYNAENTKTDFDLDPTNMIYARMSIRMEAREDTYERTKFSIFDYTGLIGGVFEIFEVFGGIIVGFFTKKWFMFWILSNLYQVQNKNDDKDLSDGSISNAINSFQNNPSEEYSKMPEKSEDEKSGGESEEEKYHKSKPNDLDQNSNSSKDTSTKHSPQKAIPLYQDKSNIMNKLKVMLQGRRSYAFSLYDYIYSYIKCWIWNTKFKKQTSLSFRNSLYKDGLTKFRKEMDTIEIIKSIRMLKMLMKILLTDDQIKLIALENSNVLCNDMGRNKFEYENQIAQNDNVIQVSCSTDQNIQNHDLQEPQVEISHEDLPKYLSKKSDEDFKHKIEKIVADFSNQEINSQNKKLLHLAYGIIENDSGQSKSFSINQLFSNQGSSIFDVKLSSSNDLPIPEFPRPNTITKNKI